MALRHTGKPRHVTLGSGIVYHQQAAVADFVGVETSFGHTCAVSIVGMAVDTRCTDIHRPEARAHAGLVCHERLLKNGLTVLERLVETLSFDSRCRLFEGIACAQQSGAEFASRIKPFRKGFLLRNRFVFNLVVRTGRQGESHARNESKPVAGSCFFHNRVITELAFSRASTRVLPAAFIAVSASAPVAFFAKGSGMVSIAAMALSMAFLTAVSASGLKDLT